MVDRLEEIAARQAEIREKLAALEEAAEPEGDEAERAQVLADRTAEVDQLLAEWDRLEAERQPLQERADRMARIRGAAVAPTSRERTGAPTLISRASPYEGAEQIRAGLVPPDDLIARARTAVEEAPRHLDDAGREHVTRMLDAEGRQAALLARHMLLTGSPEYHADFEEYIRTRGAYMGPALRAALSLSPDSQGGALVPFTLDPTIILTNIGIVDPIRPLATVRQIVTDTWHGVTSAGVTAQWLAENTAAADATPTFAQPSIATHKAFAWVFGSYEALADTGFAGELARLLADAKGRLDGAAFATGSGSGQPRGVVTAAVATTASRVPTAAASTISTADIYSMSDAATPRHAPNSVWLANKSVYNKIRQLSTNSSGGAFWASMGVGRPSELIGAPTYEASSMDSYAANTTSTPLVLADLQSYYIIDRVGMTVQYNPMVMDTTTGTPTGQAGWAAYWRVGGDQIAPEVSARVLRQTTTTSGWV